MIYTIKTERLGLRNWSTADLQSFTVMNQNPDVMRYFPSTYGRERTATLIERMQRQYEKTKYCYFAADDLWTGEFIGFIGLMFQDYPAPFTPCIDIGWRLTPSVWGRGLATEGATACLNYAFGALNLKEVYSVASVANVPSIKVMQKIGMRFQYEFKHPALVHSPDLEVCVLYKIEKSWWRK
ncbi:MAG: GNAT family N-acetyltransferase [Bacteroidota bacterium]